MATPDRQGPDLNERLLGEAHRFSFFQLVQLLMRQRPGAPAPGHTGPARDEVLRFRPAASLGFPAADVAEVEETRTDDLHARHRLTVNFMGLYGPASPMPNHFTEDILWADPEQQGARDFLDLFHHRAISLLYRAWEKYRYTQVFDRALPDEITQRMLCVLGVGTSGMREATGLALVPLLRTAGLLATRHRSAAGLERLLDVHFDGVPVRVQPCVPRKVRIPDGQRLRLAGGVGGLGRDAVLGERVADRGGSFRVELGPLDLARFRKFLPGGEHVERLTKLVRLYVADPLDFELVLRLRSEDVPALRLVDGRAPAERLPLGYMSWVAPDGRREGRVIVVIERASSMARRAPANAETARPTVTSTAAGSHPTTPVEATPRGR